MTSELNRFPNHSMMTLTAEKVRYDLAESVGPDLRLSDVYTQSELTELASLSLEYRSAQGSTDLRGVIARQHNVRTDDVITTTGGMHAIFLCGAVLCNPGDHVLVQQPLFPLTQTALAFNNADVEFFPCRFSNGYRVDVENLALRLKKETSLVCLTTPQNPSGVATPKEDIIKILDAMEQQCPDAFLLVDETYRQASYGHDSAVDSLATLDNRIISCASLSKCHGAPGLRVGWAITRHRQLRQQLINGKFQTIICCSGLDEAVAVRVLQPEQSQFDARCSHLRQGRALVANWVEKHNDQISWIAPDAGALCCVRLDYTKSNTAKTDNAAIAEFHKALPERSARVAPGDWFGDEPEVFRLGFGLLPLNELTEGLEVISNVLERCR
jgi:aspartate/methionine/tyrosine aminotransferase